MARRVLFACAVALCVAGAWIASAAGQDSAGAGAEAAAGSSATPASEQVQRGRDLFLEGCSSCHGLDARGTDGVAPDLHGVGEVSADFYLSTGRMPLSAPGDEPLRSDSRYSDEQIDAIVAYIGSLGGPRIPAVDTSKGDLGEGRELFTEHCAGCHQAAARGGIVTGGFAPDLSEATPTQVAEAIRVGPYIMPNFERETISDAQLNSIARYVEWATGPEIESPGGWGLGFLGPIPEGLVAWFIAMAALLVVARVIGERLKDGGRKEDGT